MCASSLPTTDAPLEPKADCTWVSPCFGRTPAASHRLTVMDAPDDPSRAIRWTTETWPVLIWPETAEARALGVETTAPGLLLVERGIDSAGHPLVQHRATLRADHLRGEGTLDLRSLWLVADYDATSALRGGRPALPADD